MEKGCGHSYKKHWKNDWYATVLYSSLQIGFWSTLQSLKPKDKVRLCYWVPAVNVNHDRLPTSSSEWYGPKCIY